MVPVLRIGLGDVATPHRVVSKVRTDLSLSLQTPQFIRVQSLN
jgi:hypothetical protein